MLNKAILKTSFLLIVLVELLSIFSNNLPQFGAAVFIIISVLTLILTIKKLEFGLYIIFTELFIGSKGYLFELSISETVISIRMALFLIVMSVWLAKYIKRPKEIVELVKNNKILSFLAITVTWGLLWGMFRQNGFSNVFLDFNNWLFFSLALPLLTLKNKKEFLTNILSLLVSSVIWIFIKTSFFFYIFTHNIEFLSQSMYMWIRDTLVGEVTHISGDLWRIFIQSQIFSLLALATLWFTKLTKKSILLMAVLIGTIIMSFSRSYWFGLLVIFIVLLLHHLKNKRFLQTIKNIVKMSTVSILSLIIIGIILLSPPFNGINLTGAMGSRFTTTEAAASSRTAQLGILAEEISKHPVIGSGFGKTATYFTNDPRIVPTTAGSSGIYTTYAFEWGYLDIILKIGLFGLIVYLTLILSTIKKLIKNKDDNKLKLGLALGLIALLAVNVFSPYLNHPLGIGFVLITYLYTKDEH